eukprot:NODE_2044_length_692_cov_159.293935_g1729_i0.p1 GENE.NODE_2044_length_692_cov_159.293935_g1729_i0~~NODE_2044_length_692_cov_159.293935_g1729_i0.p1  ORF type:complete len:162 (+),score=42.75 NODE_2044_length_692_cov_159.293935_g1729_i0:25-486(+)
MGNAEAHLLAIMFIVPFLSVSFALFQYNRYPSKVFVGDSYTYFAGMAIAVTGVCGHFTKTLMLFFLPQLLNFFLSLPQLFGIVPCPRHRVPRLNPATGKLEPTYNFTLLNLALYIFGPLREDTLCHVLLAFQAFCCAVAFFIRYQVASYVYES